MRTTLTQSDLDRFVGGTANWYRHALVRTVLYTDGARYVAEAAQAYWLLDHIACAQGDARYRNEPFQVWKLEVTGSAGLLICEDGDDRELGRHALDFTDFPEPGVTLWCCDNTILLPSEY